MNELKNYFLRYNGRDKWFIAMKVATIYTLRKYELTNEEICSIVNCTNRAIYYYVNMWVKPDWFDKFIEENYDRFIEEEIYPISKRKGHRRYTTYQEVTFEELKVK